METFVINLASGGILTATAEVVTKDAAAVDGAVAEDGAMTGDGTMVDPMAGAQGKDPLLSSWPFVLGVSAAVLALSIAIGVLLAKRKIKKGIELYED